MDGVIEDFIQEVTTTTGTSIIISLTAISGFGRFSDAGAASTSVYYSIESGDGGKELGLGTILSGNKLERTTPLVTAVGSNFNKSAPPRISLTGISNVGITPSSKILTDLSDDMVSKIELASNTGTLDANGGYF